MPPGIKVSNATARTSVPTTTPSALYSSEWPPCRAATTSKRPEKVECATLNSPWSTTAYADGSATRTPTPWWSGAGPRPACRPNRGPNCAAPLHRLSTLPRPSSNLSRAKAPNRGHAVGQTLSLWFQEPDKMYPQPASTPSFRPGPFQNRLDAGSMLIGKSNLQQPIIGRQVSLTRQPHNARKQALMDIRKPHGPSQSSACMRFTLKAEHRMSRTSRSVGQSACFELIHPSEVRKPTLWNLR